MFGECQSFQYKQRYGNDDYILMVYITPFYNSIIIEEFSMASLHQFKFIGIHTFFFFFNNI